MKIKYLIRGLLTLSIFIGLLTIPASVLSKEAVQTWELINPSGVIQVTPIKMAPRISALEGKTVGLKWNAKPNGNLFLNRVADLLKEKVKDVKIIKFYEVEPSTAPQSTSQEVARQKAQIIARYKPDLVIGSQCD